MEQDLDLFILWKKVIPKRWKMLSVLPLTAGLFIFLFNYFYVTPLYTASTTIVIMLPPEKQEIYSQDPFASRMLTETYLKVAYSRRVINNAVANIHFPPDTDGSKTTMSADKLRATEIIILSVTDPDPRMARDISNEWAYSFKEIIFELMQVENINIINKAFIPEKPVSPKLFSNTLAAVLFGFVGALGFAFLLELQDQMIKDPIEAQKLLDTPVIGMLPKTPKDKGHNLISTLNSHIPSTEALRTTFTKIQYSKADRPIKQILITGANTKCDQSTVVTNMGIAIASFGKSVLLVDADLRGPNLHNFFKVNNNKGLTNLIFEADYEVLHKSSVDNLTILPSGPIPPYPNEILASEKMNNLKNFFAEKFDYVLYNSPPLITFTDALVLSKIADGTIIVIDYGKVKQDTAANALEQLKKIGANVIGLIINNIPINRTDNVGYYYYYGSDGNNNNQHPKDIKGFLSLLSRKSFQRNKNHN